MENYNFDCGSVWVRNLALILREEHRLRVFENRVLRRIFGPKRDEVSEDWRKLHNLYFSSSVIRMIKSRWMKLAGNVARIEKRNAYKSVVGKREKETTWKTKT
jgi:hypothetical protein